MGGMWRCRMVETVGKYSPFVKWESVAWKCQCGSRRDWSFYFEPQLLEEPPDVFEDLATSTCNL